MSRIVRVAIYICDRCQEEIPSPEPGAFTSNYGIDNEGHKHCYPCCGALDREYMLAHGKIMLYLVSKPNPDFTGLGTMGNRHPQLWFVTNWPGSLEFKVIRGPSQSRNSQMRMYRYDVWFVGPDGHLWHGYKCGDNTDICHCKRTKTIYADLIRRK